MTKDKCYFVGVVTRPNGIKGSVSIYLDVDSPNEYSQMESVFVEINKSLVPFFINHIQIRNKGQAVVKFEGVDTEADAQRLVKAELWLPLAALPKLKGNQFYYHEIEGYSVVDKRHGAIGTIKSVLDYASNALLQIDFEGKEILIPIRDEVILSLDRSKKEMNIDAPQGLIDIYLTEKHSPNDEDAA